MDTAVEDIGNALDIIAFIMFLLLYAGLMVATRQNQLLDGFIGIAGIGCNIIGAFS